MKNGKREREERQTERVRERERERECVCECEGMKEDRECTYYLPLVDTDASAFAFLALGLMM